MSREYRKEIGDAVLTIKPGLHGDINNAVMEDNFETTQVSTTLNDAECDQLIKEFEDPDGELGAQENGIMKRCFPEFLP